MNINATTAVRSLNNSFFPAMRSTRVPVLPAVRTTRAGSCPLFAADHPTQPDIQARDSLHPVHHPRGDPPEVAEHGRAPCEDPHPYQGWGLFF